jgi:hypothetical protein
MLDALTLLSGTITNGVVAGQAITATAASTNVLDLLANRDIGAGSADIMLNIEVTAAFATLTSLQVALQTSADNSTWVDLMLSPVILTANLVVGARILRVNLPAFGLNDTGTPNRYMRLNYTVAGSNATTGAIIAYLSGMGDQNNPGVNYPANYTTA